MIQWEYITVEGITKANERGKEGWEAVGFYYYGGYVILMKRSLVNKEIL